MSTLYIQYDNSNNIIGVYANNQPDITTGTLDSSDPNVLAYYASQTTVPTTSIRTLATNDLTSKKVDSCLMRAILLTILDELNTIRSKLSPPLAAITISQAENAVLSKISSGAAD